MSVEPIIPPLWRPAPLFALEGTVCYVPQKKHADAISACMAASTALEDLSRRALGKDSAALGYLVTVLENAVGNLVDIAKMQPEFARDCLERRNSMPISLGPNAGQLSEAKQLLDAMNVGGRTPYNIKQHDRQAGKRGRPGPSVNTPANAIAAEISQKMKEFVAFPLAERAKPIPDWLEVTYLVCGCAELDQTNARKWADTAIMILEAHYGRDLAAVPRLAELGKSSARQYSRSKRGRSAAARRAERAATGTIEDWQQLSTPADVSRSELANVNARIRSELRAAFRRIARARE